ncbi:ABC transporter substrate-binding protein [Corynebacterium atypicum]|uniref:ABC transporter substrate-binding protein n=1 Tax=Corynebacterium atypicum TaxID=191610 RepID=UPI000A038C6F|nr:ABC transporter substrate-binding protein [Corynebacterium atypicum]
MKALRLSSMWAAAVVVLPLAACGGGDTPQAGSAADNSDNALISVTNCGIDYHLDSPVRRAVTLEQGQTETLLALGVSEQMAGTSHKKDVIRPEWQEAFDSVPVLSAEPATNEQIRDADADFIYSGFASNYTRESAGDRQEWQDLGVVAYLTNTECREVDDNAGVPAFELMKKDYRQLGAFFDKADRAEELIAEQDRVVRHAQQVAEKIDGSPSIALFYSSYEGAPYIAGRTSLAQDMFELLGARNVFEDVEEDWPTVSWEAFADRDPDVIVLADLAGRGKPGDTYQEKIAELENNPATKNLRAVQGKRYIVVPAIGLTPNVRAPEVLEVLAGALADGVDGLTGATATGKL